MTATTTTHGTTNGSVGLERRPTGALLSDISSDVVTLVGVRFLVRRRRAHRARRTGLDVATLTSALHRALPEAASALRGTLPDELPHPVERLVERLAA